MRRRVQITLSGDEKRSLMNGTSDANLFNGFYEMWTPPQGTSKTHSNFAKLIVLEHLSEALQKMLKEQQAAAAPAKEKQDV